MAPNPTSIFGKELDQILRRQKIYGAIVVVEIVLLAVDGYLMVGFIGTGGIAGDRRATMELISFLTWQNRSTVIAIIFLLSALVALAEVARRALRAKWRVSLDQ